MQNKDILFSLALNSDLPTILNLCLTNKSAAENICKNENFWLKKLEKEGIDYKDVIENATEVFKQYGELNLTPNISPNVFYRYLFMEPPLETYELSDNAHTLYVSFHKGNNGKFIVDVLDESYDGILPDHIFENEELLDRIYNVNEDYVLIPFYRFENIERVIPGIPQERAWSADEWNQKRGKPNFYGNTVLLDKGNNEYVFLKGQKISTFKIPEGEHITELFSFMGNNTVPYPFAISVDQDENEYLYDLSWYYVKIDKSRLPFEFNEPDDTYPLLDYMEEHREEFPTFETHTLMRYL